MRGNYLKYPTDSSIQPIPFRTSEDKIPHVRTNYGRHNNPNYGQEGIVLPDSGFVRHGSIRPQVGFCPAGRNEGWEGRYVQVETGDNGQEAGGDGRDSGINFPAGVHFIIAVFVCFAFALGFSSAVVWEAVAR